MTPGTPDPEVHSSPSTATLVRRWGYGLIALQFVVRGYVIFPSYFFQDDFAHLDLARRHGLSQDYLFRDYGGHLETGPWLVIWLFSHVIDVSFWPAAVSILLLQLWASLLLFKVMRELFGATPVILVPLAIYLFTPLSLAWATWWSAALEALPLQVAMLTVLLCMTRLYRTQERRWAVWSVVAHVLGLLFWEKAALILPTALAVIILLVVRPSSWRELIGTLRAHWRVWLVHAGVLVGYVVVYVTYAGSPGEGLGRSTAGQLLSQTMGRMYVPGILGAPWRAQGAENTVYPYADSFVVAVSCALLAAVVWASFAVNGRRALNAWVLLVGYLATDLALLGSGRAEWLGLLARDPRYLADAMPITAIALAAAFHIPEGAGSKGRAQAIMRQHATVPTAVKVAAAIVVSCLITTFKLAPVAQHEYSHNFSMGVLRQMTEDPQRSVVSTAAPFVVSARADVAQMMNAIGADVEFNRPATQMYLFDGLANMRKMALLGGTQVHRGPQKGCGWAVRPGWVEVASIPASKDPVRVLRLGYYTRQAGDLRVRVGGSSQHLKLRTGLGYAYFVITSNAGSLQATFTAADGACLTDWAAGPPWVAE